MAHPYDLEFKQITGKFSDLVLDPITGEYKTRPTEGFVYITPAIKDFYVTSVGRRINLDELLPNRVKMNSLGEFTVLLPVVDQPGITPVNWTYEIKTSWTDSVANIAVTQAMPEVININEYFDDPVLDGQIVTVGPRGENGRGIETITASGTIATVHYTDGTTSQFNIPWGSGGGGFVNYTHVQNDPQQDWTITHNLNRSIAACYVTTGTGVGEEQIYAQYTIKDPNTIVVHHGAACSGKAILQ